MHVYLNIAYMSLHSSLFTVGNDDINVYVYVYVYVLDSCVIYEGESGN